MSRVFDEKIAINTIKRTINHFINTNAYLLRFYERDDLVHEIYCWFLEKGFFPKYNPQVTSFEYFVAAATKNRLIDFTRKRVLNTRSLNNTFINNEKEGTETSLIDMIEDMVSIDPESLLTLKDLIENIPDEQISPNYCLSWRDLLVLALEDCTPAEISDEVIVTKRGGTRKLSQGRISQLLLMLRDKCAETVKGKINRDKKSCTPLFI